MASLTCGECGARATGAAAGWVAYLADLDEDGQDELVPFCPVCDSREFSHDDSGNRDAYGPE